ncbi:hypothetical protein Tco_0772684 [Tanacetum coccineum]|uniref:Uncharacterized protein n=1 Tax=Tanacetum coccineum TaxID=301880 RepID=A0ABQ4ZMF8_9ASTR
MLYLHKRTVAQLPEGFCLSKNIFYGLVRNDLDRMSFKRSAPHYWTGHCLPFDLSAVLLRQPRLPLLGMHTMSPSERAVIMMEGILSASSSAEKLPLPPGSIGTHAYFLVMFLRVLKKGRALSAGTCQEPDLNEARLSLDFAFTLYILGSEMIGLCSFWGFPDSSDVNHVIPKICPLTPNEHFLGFSFMFIAFKFSNVSANVRQEILLIFAFDNHVIHICF